MRGWGGIPPHHTQQRQTWLLKLRPDASEPDQNQLREHILQQSQHRPCLEAPHAWYGGSTTVTPTHWRDGWTDAQSMTGR